MTKKSHKFQTIKAKTADLIPYARNSRTHNEDQINQIASSIKEFGFTNPVIIDEDNGIIAGHGRILAAKKLSIEEVPCIQVKGWTEAQKKAYVIADNKLALNAGWDNEMLALEFQELQELDFDLEMTGFSLDEINDLMPQDETEGLTDEDAAPELTEDPVSIEGDIWLLGEHRVMCGDSTDAGSVALLMDGQKADMVFTDPPYGMSYGGGRAEGKHARNKAGGVLIKAHGMIKNDDLQGDDLISLVKESTARLVENKKEGAACYICFTWRTYSEFELALESAGCDIKGCIVWDKKSIGLGNSNYRPQHEFIFYTGGQWYGNKSQADVWYMSRGATGEYVHPTQKPVELIETAINNSSKKGDIVSDAFLGSGSTLIACEKTNRKCYGMELDPKYCDVIIKRWEEFTGNKAVHESGKLYDQLKEERHGG